MFTPQAVRLKGVDNRIVITRQVLRACCDFLPHAFGGAVGEVLQQLRETQHGLEHQSQGAQHLHEHGRVQQQQGDHRTQHGEAEAEEQVVLERAPLPEVAQVQVWRFGDKNNHTDTES